MHKEDQMDMKISDKIKSSTPSLDAQQKNTLDKTTTTIKKLATNFFRILKQNYS